MVYTRTALVKILIMAYSTNKPLDHIIIVGLMSCAVFNFTLNWKF